MGHRIHIDVIALKYFHERFGHSVAVWRKIWRALGNNPDLISTLVLTSALKAVRAIASIASLYSDFAYQGLKEDGYSVSISKLCRWFEVPRRTVYYLLDF
jgi:hypothetical protein